MCHLADGIIEIPRNFLPEIQFSLENDQPPPPPRGCSFLSPGPRPWCTRSSNNAYKNPGKSALRRFF